jgi:hypothetical protein
MDIRRLATKLLRPGLVVLGMTASLLSAAPATAQPYISFGFGIGGEYPYSYGYSDDYSYHYRPRYYAPYHYRPYYFRPHHYMHRRQLSYCDIYPYNYKCMPHRRHHRMYGYGSGY